MEPLPPRTTEALLTDVGAKWLSETYMWKRAPADLKRCGA